MASLNWLTSVPPSLRSIITPMRTSTTFNCRKRKPVLNNLSSSSQPGFCSKRFAALLKVVPQRMTILTTSMVPFEQLGASKASGVPTRSLQSACGKSWLPCLTQPKVEMAISRRHDAWPKLMGLSVISSTTLKDESRLVMGERMNEHTVLCIEMIYMDSLEGWGSLTYDPRWCKDIREMVQIVCERLEPREGPTWARSTLNQNPIFELQKQPTHQRSMLQQCHCILWSSHVVG